MGQPDKLVCPDEAEAALAKTRDLMRRGGVVLTRRDILRYVAAEAGIRAKEIEELLHLKNVHDVRTSFVRARTDLTRNEKAAQTAIDTAKAEVNVTLGLPKYSDDGLLEAINSSRHTLGGEAVDLLKSSGFKSGIVPPMARDTASTPVNTSSILQTVNNIGEVARSIAVPELARNDEVLRRNITNIQANPAVLAELERLEFTRHAVKFVEESTVECPVCGTLWPEGELKKHLDARIATAQAASALQKSISDAVETISAPARTLLANINALSESLRSVQVNLGEDDIKVLSYWHSGLSNLLTAVADPLARYLESGLSANGVARMFIPDTLVHMLDRIERSVKDALPTPSSEQAAWDKLTRLEESVRALENRTGEATVAKLYAERSRVLVKEYERARDKILDGLYSRIADRFIEFYRVLHSHEGDHFGARLQPQGAALDFEVDFMGPWVASASRSPQRRTSR